MSDEILTETGHSDSPDQLGQVFPDAARTLITLGQEQLEPRRCPDHSSEAADVQLTLLQPVQY